MNIKAEMAKRGEAQLEKEIANMKATKETAPKKRGRKSTLTETEREERKRKWYERKKMQMQKEAGVYFDSINKGKTPEEAELAARKFIADFPPKNQEAKADAGKPRLSLVPMKILEAIARVREYGTAKYHDPDNWKKVELSRYRDALLRHIVAYIDDPHGVDAESGLPHLWHAACNMAFIVSMESK